VNIEKILKAIETEPCERYESENLDFKGYFDSKHLFSRGTDIAKGICAMANKNGGSIVVGVKDSSEISGGRWAEQLVGIEIMDCLEVEKRIGGNLSPAINLQVNNLSYNGNNYLTISCKPNDEGLVMTSSGRCYIRTGRDSVPMTPDQVAEKVKSARGYDWSSEVFQNIEVDDALDDDQVEQALLQYHELKQLGDDRLPREFFLESIGVTQNGLLTKGGLLFLGHKDIIESEIGHIEYRFSRSQGGGRLSINEVWSGSIWSAVYKIRALLKKVISYESFVFDEKVYTFPNVAHAMFDEAVVNMLVHRDYSLDGMVAIEFSSSSVTLVNPGTFFGGITPDNIFTYPPRHRNRSLAEILRKFELLDRAGFGTRRMGIESLRLGRNKPSFREDAGFIHTSLELGAIKEGVYVVASPYEDYDVTELMLINLLYDSGCEVITDIIRELTSVTLDPWQAVQAALPRMPFLSLVGNKHGVYLVVDESHCEVLNAHHQIRVFASSNSYVSIFTHLMIHHSDDARRLANAATNGDVEKVKRLLNSAAFVEKVGRGSNSKWKLV